MSDNEDAVDLRMYVSCFALEKLGGGGSFSRRVVEKKGGRRITITRRYSANDALSIEQGIALNKAAEYTHISLPGSKAVIAPWPTL